MIRHLLEAKGIFTKGAEEVRVSCQTLVKKAWEFYELVRNSGWIDSGNVKGLNHNSPNVKKAWDQLVLVPAPEPTTLLLLGSGLIRLGIFGRKRFKRKS